MSNLIKTIFGSCLGVIAAFLVIALVGGSILGFIASKAEQGKPVKANSVLHLTFDTAIPEQTGNAEVDFSDFSTEKKLGLTDLVKAIKTAKTDDKIKGIYLNVNTMALGAAKASVLRDAIEDFKNSEKFVIAYSKAYSQGGYYLSSVADKVYLNPLGGVDFRGYGVALTFFKDALEELGIEMEVFKVGKFKGAVEPFVLNKLSDENRLQIEEFLNGLWNEAKRDIATSRGKSVADLEQIANDYSGRNASSALTAGLIDAVAYEDEALADISTRLGIEKKDRVNLIKLGDYFRSAVKKKTGGKNRVAIIYAEGSIIDGKSEAGQIGDNTYVKIIRKLRKNDKVKAIVLRVNSGGGSAMASENIWRELKLCQEAGKTVVTSMGDYAASGGYYISCASDRVFAEPNTITGSIGVFGLMPNMTELLNDKMHLHFDTVKTNKYATSFLPTQKMTEEEKAIMQNQTNSIYDIFLTRVKDARDFPSKDAVNEIAQGRVWTGRKALELGLVDKLGGLDNAVASAVTLAGLDEYRIAEYPKQKTPVEKMLQQLTGEDLSISNSVLKSQLGEYYPYYENLQRVKQMKGVQAIMPFTLEVY